MEIVRILFLAADPRSASRLALDEEVRAISERLRAGGAGHRIELRVEWAVRAQELPTLLLRHRPQIVHFSGHGSQADELFLVGQDSSAATLGSQETLRQIIEALRDDIRCVVLSACYSAAQAAALVQVIPCVVGLPRAVRDNAGQAFAAGFYEALTFGRSVQMAFHLAREQTELAQVGNEPVIPLLVLQPGIDAKRFTLFDGHASAASTSPSYASAVEGPTTSPAIGTHLILCFSSQDADGKAEVATQLTPLLRGSALSLWSTDDIPYGASSPHAFAHEVERADAALLLLTASFLVDPKVEEQLAQLREQHKRRGVRIIPLVWRACSWQTVEWLRPLLPAPRDGSPLMSMDKPRREYELVRIVSQLKLRPVRDLAAGSSARVQPMVQSTGNGERLLGAQRTQRPLSVVDPGLARRAYGYGEPLLDCDRGEQWENLRALVRNEHHELILVPGAVGQAHRFFLDRIEIALPSDPPRRVVRVDWEAPKDLAVPQFRRNRREALAALAQALDVPSASLDELPKALHSQLEEHHLILLHPMVNRCLGEVELSQYYCEWIPELLGSSRTTYRCKLVQPIEWSAPAKNLIQSMKRFFGRGGARAVQADERQALAFMQVVKKRTADEAKKLLQPQVLRVTQLPELAQLLKKDVVKFLEIIHYGDSRPEPDATRSALADHVLDGDASSEQILQRLCRELPRELWPSGTP